MFKGTDMKHCWLPRLVLSALMLCALPSVAGEHGEGGSRLLLTPPNKADKEECASCHMAYPPGLLMASGWQKMMGGLNKHFGSNASMDAATAKEITQFLTLHAADRATGRFQSKVAREGGRDAGVIRISETAWFVRKHDEVSPSVYKRKAIGSVANCMACHRGAERGDYDEHAVSIPR